MENIFIQPPVATITWGSNFKYENKLINLSLCQFIGKVESDTRFGIKFDFQDKEHTWFFITNQLSVKYKEFIQKHFQHYDFTIRLSWIKIAILFR
mgnify:CR=1 FL=1